MKRFKNIIDATLNVANVRDTARLKSFGVECTYLPDPVEDFDEFEFKTDFQGRDIIICFAVQMGKIKRLMFARADADDPDEVIGLSAAELEGFLAEKGEQVLQFYRYITG